MVHRPLYLGISMGVNPDIPSLDISISINDGFFVLGTKNYSFPIIKNEDEYKSPSTTILLPSLAQTHSPNDENPPTADMELEEIKGMYIDLKRKILLKPYFTTELSEKKKKIQENNRFVSKLPPEIELEIAKNECATYSGSLGIDNFDDEVFTVLSGIFLVTIDKWLAEYTAGNAVKIVGIGLSADVINNSELGDSVKTMLWNKYDILPSFFSGNCMPLDQQSEALARKCASLFRHENLPGMTIAESNKVVVDSGHIWYCSLEDYKESIGEKGSELMKDLKEEAENTIQNKTRIAFFSSTSQGGGVALMRHSLIRFFQMLGIDASWYVCTPSPSIFNITKKKVHNVLQNVSWNAPAQGIPNGTELKDTLDLAEKSELNKNESAQAENKEESSPKEEPSNWLTEENQDRIDKWLESNYNSHWRKVVQNSTVVVLDDHQVARLAKIIRKDAPEIRIIYRSHIQIRTECMQDALQTQKPSAIDNVWSFLWDSLQYVDYFVSHPIDTFVPKNVPRNKLIFQPAGTDQLDGLNKPLSALTNGYYQNVFNRICLDNGESPVNFSKKYIVQVARFDPSKGIEDLLNAYYEVFYKFKTNRPDETFDVGLVLCGHGSVDDPEGMIIYKGICEIVKNEKYQEIRHLITKVLLPPSDQLLNMILRNAYIACQLSTSEGFEVKVTESLMKKIPVVVYRVGGLPLQVTDGVNGFIVEKGNIEEVVDRVYALLTDDALYKKIKEGINPKDFMIITTPFQVLFWLKMFNPETKKPNEYYKDFIKKYLR